MGRRAYVDCCHFLCGNPELRHESKFWPSSWEFSVRMYGHGVGLRQLQYLLAFVAQHSCTAKELLVWLGGILANRVLLPETVC